MSGRNQHDIRSFEADDRAYVEYAETVDTLTVQLRKDWHGVVAAYEGRNGMVAAKCRQAQQTAQQLADAYGAMAAGFEQDSQTSA